MSLNADSVSIETIEASQTLNPNERQNIKLQNTFIFNKISYLDRTGVTRSHR